MIAIIGAGISGLVLAYRLQAAGIPYTLLESKKQAGGYIWSERLANGYLIEYGPNSILADAQTDKLIQELGIAHQVAEALPVSQNRFILKNGKYHVLPQSPPALLKSNFFSLGTRLKIVSEFIHNSKGPEKESLASFFRRHFGQEVVDYALSPFVAGIYAGDPEQLITEYTFPQLLKFEKEHGSILKGLIKSASGKRRRSINFKEGLQTFTDALAAHLSHLKYGHQVKTISRTTEGKWDLAVSCQGGSMTMLADKVVLAIPAFEAEYILPQSHAALAKALGTIHYPPITVVHLVYKKSSLPHIPAGFGGLHPPKEKRFSLGLIYNSAVFEGRTAEDEFMFTMLIGGSIAPANCFNEKSDPEKERLILAGAVKEMEELYQVSALPAFYKITSWRRSIPQYNRALDRVYELEASANADGLFYCANWAHGISLNDAVNKATELATRFAKG